MISKKICMIGAYGVGKTSLVARYVHALFSEKYHTTIGVKTDKKVVSVAGRDVTLMLWDLAGEDKAQPAPLEYLRGAAGCLLVADATRRGTVETALDLRTRIAAATQPPPQVVAALNKIDLDAERDVDAAEALASFTAAGAAAFETSAKTGAGVEEAFAELARQVAT